MNELGCSDGFCYIKGKAKGMHTNGGCRCVKNLVGRNNTAAQVALEKRLADLHKTIESLRTQLSQREAAVREFVDFLMVVQLRFDLGETGEQADELIAKHSNQSAEGR